MAILEYTRTCTRVLVLSTRVRTRVLVHGVPRYVLEDVLVHVYVYVLEYQYTCTYWRDSSVVPVLEYSEYHGKVHEY